MSDAVKDAICDFRILRARAINTYGQLEQSQLLVFAALLGVDIIKASAVLSRMQSANSRHAMIDDLLTQANGDKYDEFYSKLRKKLSAIDEARNKIVHWVELVSTSGGSQFNPEKDIALHKSAFTVNSSKFDARDLRDFIEKTEFFRLLMYYFSWHLEGRPIPQDPSRTPWREIFLQPPEYPPNSLHPLFPTSTTPPIQPTASQQLI